MKISVIIPTCGRDTTIVDSIKALLDNTVLPDEIIIVDQSSDEKTRDAVSSFSNELLHYLHDDVGGVSRARNLGWQYASGEIMAFTDDDATVGNKWIESILHAFDVYGDEMGICGGIIRPVFHEVNPDWSMPEMFRALLPEYEYDGAMGDYVHGVPASVNFSITKDLLLRLGGFNECLGSNHKRNVFLSREDSDLAKRVKEANYRLIFNPDCIVYHPVPLQRQTQEFLNKRLYIEGVSRVYMRLLNRKYPLLSYLKPVFAIPLDIISLYFRRKSIPDEYDALRFRIKGDIHGYRTFFRWRKGKT